MDETRQINHATLIPLIGGMAIGQRNAFGTEPIWEASFEPFRENDYSYVKHFDVDMKYIQGNTFEEYKDYFEQLSLPYADVVSTVPPCAGLSMLNRECSIRGSNAPQNEWIYVGAKLLMTTMRPEVIIGENAPGLFTKMGDGVRMNLLELAYDYGYSIMFIKTDTYLHGVPQHRHRTFYLFFKGENLPIFNYIKKDVIPLGEFLKDVPFNPEDVISDKLTKDISFKYISQYPEWREILSEYLDVWHVIIALDLWEDFENFASKHTGGEKWIKKSHFIQEKLSRGKGFWNDSITYYGDKSINAVIGKNVSRTLHPTEDRAFTHQELLYLMGHPIDFKLQTKLGHIFQNVPSKTAESWFLEIKEYLLGNRKSLRTEAMMFNNTKQKYYTNTLTYGKSWDDI